MTPHTDAAPLGVERTSPDLAAVEARAATYERAGWDVTASGPGAEGRATVTRCDAAAHASAADVPTLLAHVRRLTAALADSDARVASAVAVARDDERERAASVAESHAIDCDLDAEDERTNGTLGGCTVAQDRAKLARMIRDGIRKPACTICEEPATCFGSSEGDPPSYHCDDCCGHGGEDGHCEPVGADAIATTPATGGAQ